MFLAARPHDEMVAWEKSTDPQVLNRCGKRR